MGTVSITCLTWAGVCVSELEEQREESKVANDSDGKKKCQMLENFNSHPPSPLPKKKIRRSLLRGTGILGYPGTY